MDFQDITSRRKKSEEIHILREWLTIVFHKTKSKFRCLKKDAQDKIPQSTGMI